MMKRDWSQQGEDLLEHFLVTKPKPYTVAAWYVGQVGYVFKGETIVCVDPVFTPLLNENGQDVRLYPPPFPPDAHLWPDVVICTHGHADHMAIPTLLAMADACPYTTFCVPSGCVDELIAAGLHPLRVIGLQAGETVQLPGVTIRPVQAAHPTHQTDEAGRDLALCLHLTMNDVFLLHLGDTYLTDQLLNDLDALPTPDAMFTPINGGDYFRTARNCIGNLNPLESARLCTLLHAGLCVPTHFDMVDGNTCDPLEFVRCLWAENPKARFAIPALGERIWIEKRR